MTKRKFWQGHVEPTCRLGHIASLGSIPLSQKELESNKRYKDKSTLNAMA
jgi:hypothetical protein